MPLLPPLPLDSLASGMNISNWIEKTLEEVAPKSKSLIVTVYGDALMPVSDRIWLGELIELMAPFNVNERLVRTSCFRLIDEGWFTARREGRRSEYALTAAGRRRLELAYQRVYAPPVTDWDGRWTLVITPRSAEAGVNRGELRRELEWEGFAQLTPGVMIHPVEQSAVLQELLGARALGDRVIALRADELPGIGSSRRETIAQCWNLDAVAERYRTFITRFERLPSALGRSAPDARQAFLIQTLMIHAFRRATLHDPRLPAVMLPADWPGAAAFELCKSLYARTVDAAQLHVTATLASTTASATAGHRSAMLQQRFGGLQDR